MRYYFITAVSKNAGQGRKKPHGIVLIIMDTESDRKFDSLTGEVRLPGSDTFYRILPRVDIKDVTAPNQPKLRVTQMRAKIGGPSRVKDRDFEGDGELIATVTTEPPIKDEQIRLDLADSDEMFEGGEGV